MAHDDGEKVVSIATHPKFRKVEPPGMPAVIGVSKEMIDPSDDAAVSVALKLLDTLHTQSADTPRLTVVVALNLVYSTLQAECLKECGEKETAEMLGAALLISNLYEPVFPGRDEQ